MSDPTHEPHEPEPDKLFDHEYDGIREYDNPMPRWWLVIFAISIVLAFPYALYYHFGDGPSIFDQLNSEIAAYADQLMTTYGELQSDESTILQYMGDDVAMTGMAGLFKGKCASCHLADGSGSVGPNLTDDRWINVKQVTDISGILKEGVVTKGMPAWKDKLTETQIVLLSSYVARLRDQPVDGKPAQGDPIAPWPEAPPMPATDTAAQDAEGTH